MTAPKALDLVCIGRAAVDLYGEQTGGRLEDMASFAKYLGGCAANIAVGAARLGLDVAMIARVGDEHMGRFVREQLAAEGVRTEHVKTDPKRLTGLVILGIRDEDTFPLIFYRENCADMAIEPADVDEALVASARALLVTGTHFSTAAVDAASRRAIEIARAAGTAVVLDIDYRPVLWGLTGRGLGEERFVASDDVTRHLQTILPLCDLVVGTEEEIHIAGGSTDTDVALAAIRRLTAAVIVMKRGGRGCLVVEGAAAAGVEVPGFAVEVFNVLGAGDGFMAGLLSGVLRGKPWPEAARLANACGALVVARHGCAPAMPSAAELSHFLARADAIRRPREDARLAHLHRATTGRPAPETVLALAFDHRLQLEEAAARLGAGPERIGRFKTIVADMLGGLPPERSGAIVDERHGRTALAKLTGTGRWLARPVERPSIRPLAFDFPGEAAARLRAWPVEHVAKCLVLTDDADGEALWAEQIAGLRAVAATCEAMGRRFLIEVIPQGWQDAPVLVAAHVERLAAAGVKPDWWKLPPLGREAEWREVGAVVRAADAHCRGVVVLGLDRPDAELATAFEAAAAEPAVIGFAIGRSVFRAAAEDYLSGEIAETEAAARVRERYLAVLGLWDRRGAARAAAE